MTKKDYILLANALYTADGVHTEEQYKLWCEIVANIGEALSKDNEKFNSSVFMQACHGGRV